MNFILAQPNDTEIQKYYLLRAIYIHHIYIHIPHDIEAHVMEFPTPEQCKQYCWLFMLRIETKYGCIT